MASRRTLRSTTAMRLKSQFWTYFWSLWSSSSLLSIQSSVRGLSCTSIQQQNNKSLQNASKWPIQVGFTVYQWAQFSSYTRHFHMIISTKYTLYSFVNWNVLRRTIKLSCGRTASYLEPGRSNRKSQFVVYKPLYATTQFVASRLREDEPRCFIKAKDTSTLSRMPAQSCRISKQSARLLQRFVSPLFYLLVVLSANYKRQKCK